jgi:mannose-6-phosphate isomerase-like protein (cupin superfamily)
LDNITLKTVPTREDIKNFESQLKLLPQEEGMKTDHFFVPGMYCRKLWRPAGTIIVGKVHKAPHFFVCVSGTIAVWSEFGYKELNPGDVIETKPGTKRVTYALTDAIGMTIHKTDNTDLDEIEKELIEEDDTALFDSDNKLKFDVPKFRSLTSEVIAEEKIGFWSDFSKEQQRLYLSGDWEAFSVSRGYSDESIAKYRQWRNMIANALSMGMDPYKLIVDLTTEAACKNIALDKNNEIAKTSHLPFASRQENIL